MKKRPHSKIYKHMNELGVENFYIELIENFPCNDIYELRAREGHFIREIGTLNKQIAGRPIKEYRKQYHEEHKELIKENKKEYLKEYDKERNKIKISCPNCNIEVNNRYLPRHQKTNKCKNTQILS